MALVILGQVQWVHGDSCAEVAGHVTRALPGSEVECLNGKCQLLILDMASVSTANFTWAANLLRDCEQHHHRRRLVTQLTNANIHDAVRAWLADEANATSVYGHISNWDTSEVTNMDSLFCSDSESCVGKNKSSAAAFNSNISSWNVGKVTSMRTSKLKNTFTVITFQILTLFKVFLVARFNRDLSNWNGQMLPTCTRVSRDPRVRLVSVCSTHSWIYSVSRYMNSTAILAMECCAAIIWAMVSFCHESCEICLLQSSNKLYITLKL